MITLRSGNILICLMLEFALFSCGKQEADPLDRSWSLRPLTSSYTELIYTQELQNGVPTHLRDSDHIVIRASFDPVLNQCSLEVQDLESKVTRTGTLHQGEYAQFAPEIFGTHGLQLESVRDGIVVVCIRSGSSNIEHP